MTEISKKQADLLNKKATEIDLIVEKLKSFTIEDLEIVKNYVEKFNSKNQIVTIDNIIEAVCEFHRQNFDDVKSVSQADIFRIPRQRIMYFCIEVFNLCSLQQIGNRFNGRNGGVRDHATVLSAVKVIKNSTFRNKIKQMELEMIYNLIIEKSKLNQ